MEKRIFFVILITVISILLISCPEQDTAAPAEVIDLTAIVTGGQVILTWTDPVDNDFDHVEISCNPSDLEMPTVEAGIQTCTVTGISSETAYAFTARTVDTMGNISEGIITTAIILSDYLVPAEVANLTTDVGTFVVYLSWTDPTNLDFDHVEITEWFDGYVLSTQSVPSGVQGYMSTVLPYDTAYGFLVRTVNSNNDISYGLTLPGISTYAHFEHTVSGAFDGAFSVFSEDVDGDGDMDILGAASIADDITWWENDGGENFTEHTIADSFDIANSVYAADIDGDGDLDVLGSSAGSGFSWWENDGEKSFTEHPITGSYSGSNDIYAEDIDGDGDEDIVGVASIGGLIWWENNGSGTFTEHEIASYINGALDVYAKDINEDGDMDVLIAAPMDGIMWWENDGSESFTDHTITSSFNPSSIDATDVDGDGDVDVLGADNSAGEISWWQNDGSENFTVFNITDTFTGARCVYAEDVNGDGDLDVLGAAESANDITWWENDGSENFTEHTIAGAFDGAQSVYAVDVDGDGDMDVLGAASIADDITWWENE